MIPSRWANHVAPCSFRFLGQVWMSKTLKDRYTRKFKLSGREEEPVLRNESPSIVWKHLCFSATDINQETICKECCRSAPQSNLTNLFKCLKTQRKLQYNECMKVKKNNAAVVNRNYPTSTQRATTHERILPAHKDALKSPISRLQFGQNPINTLNT